MAVFPTPPYYCRTCRLALNLYQSPPDRVIRFVHAAQLRGEAVDHEPDPLPLADLGPDAIMVCDFCSTASPSTVYQCADQATDVHAITRQVVAHADYTDRHTAARVRRTDTEHRGTQMWGQRWAAFDECAALIEARDLYGLISRSMANMPAKYTRGKRLIQVRGELHQTFSHVLDTLAPAEVTSAPTIRSVSGTTTSTRPSSQPDQRPRLVA